MANSGSSSRARIDSPASSRPVASLASRSARAASSSARAASCSARACSWVARSASSAARCWLVKATPAAARETRAAAPNPARMPWRRRRRLVRCSSSAMRLVSMRSRSSPLRARSVEAARVSNCSRRPPPSRIAGLFARSFPFGGGLGEAAVQQQVLASLVDPAPQPVPVGEQRLVGDLDGGGAGGGMAVEGEQPVLAVAVQHLVDRGGFDGEAPQLAAGHPPPGVLGGLVDGDQPEEHLAGRLLPGVVELLVDVVGAPAQRPDHPTGAQVVGFGEPVAAAPFEQFGERILEQRESTGLVGDVSGDPLCQPRLQADPDVLCRSGDRLGQLVRDRGRPPSPWRRPTGHRTRGSGEAGPRSRPAR